MTNAKHYLEDLTNPLKKKGKRWQSKTHYFNVSQGSKRTNSLH